MEFFFNGNVIIPAFFYIISAIIGFFSAFGVYILIRYGTSRTFALATSLVYSFIFLNFLNTSFKLLQSLSR